MTKAELNKEVKALWKKVKSTEVFCEWTETEIEAKYKILYYVDHDFTYLNRDNVLRMVIMNRKFHIIPWHQFGLDIDEDRL